MRNTPVKKAIDVHALRAVVSSDSISVSSWNGRWIALVDDASERLGFHIGDTTIAVVREQFAAGAIAEAFARDKPRKGMASFGLKLAVDPPEDPYGGSCMYLKADIDEVKRLSKIYKEREALGAAAPLPAAPLSAPSKPRVRPGL